jgi:hypothetical protein
MLSAYVATSQRDWDSHLPFLVFAYHSAVQSTTGVSPFVALYGREPQLPSDHILQATPALPYMDEPTYADYLTSFLPQVWKFAQENITRSQTQYAQRYDSTGHPHSFKIGDFVLVHNPSTKKGISPKLQRQWQGPFRIIECNAQTLRLVPKSRPGKNPRTVHANRCKLCHAEEATPPIQPSIPQIPDVPPPPPPPHPTPPPSTVVDAEPPSPTATIPQRYPLRGRTHLQSAGLQA